MRAPLSCFCCLSSRSFRFFFPSKHKGAGAHHWLAQEVLNEVQVKLREVTKRPVTLDARHRAALQEVFARGKASEFWRCVDALYTAAAAAEWSSVRNEASFVQSLLRKALAPASGSVHRPSPVLVALLAAKFGPELEAIFPGASSVPPPQPSQPPHTLSRKDGETKASVSDTSAQQDAAWEAAQTVFDAIERRASERAGRSIRFDERHKGSLRSMLIAHRGGPGFWSCVDQLAMRLLALEWATVRGDTSFIQSVLSNVSAHPVSDHDYKGISSPRECAQLLLAKINRRDAHTALPPPPPPPQAASSLPPSTVAFQARLESFYTWGLAERVIDQMGKYLTDVLGRRIVFDAMHRETLRLKFHRDPLGFWSILDQILDKFCAVFLSLLFAYVFPR